MLVGQFVADADCPVKHLANKIMSEVQKRETPESDHLPSPLPIVSAVVDTLMLTVFLKISFTLHR